MSDTTAAAGHRHSELAFHIVPDGMPPQSVQDDLSHRVSLYLCLVFIYY